MSEKLAYWFFSEANMRVTTSARYEMIIKKNNI